jgi:hypothetical protein
MKSQDREEWMLLDGGAKGLGTLLAEVPLREDSGTVLAEVNSQRKFCRA